AAETCRQAERMCRKCRKSIFLAQISDFTNITGYLPLTRCGHRYVLVVMDYFTKYLNLYALSDQRATTVAKCLFEDYISHHGVPQSLHTDQELCSRLGIHKTRTSPYHAMSDGMVEWANRAIKDQLAKYLYARGGEGVGHLRQVEFAFNTSVHSSTKHTPFSLAHGREARLPADVLLGDSPAVSNATRGTPSEHANSVLRRLCAAFHSVAQNIEAAVAQQKHYYDSRMKHTAYEPGDLVWVDLPALARQKLSPKWSGPFKILQRFGSGGGGIGVDYELLDQRDPRAKPKVIHYNRLKPHRSAWLQRPRDPNEDKRY
uniref:Integrase catalytic domain-containing protein n=1 Tax=Cyclopterus lumpus TaxID=8103 RepID=A0A8C2Z9W3_CYCLU